MDTVEADTRAELIARYKDWLKHCIDRRPSGLRGRLALALGKHKSFVSQITNPAYPVPIPAGDLTTIFEVCHFSAHERERFQELYRAAHPQRRPRRPRPGDQPHELRIAVPRFRNETIQREVEAMILDFAARTIRLAERLEGEGDQRGGQTS